MRAALLLYFLGFWAGNVVSQENYPLPPAKSDRLFFIQHSGNTNTYVYDANFAKPKMFHEADPVKIYRLMFAEGGEKRELTYPQLKFAYGLNITKLGNNQFELSLVSFPKQKLVLRLDKKGRAFVETVVNGRKLLVNRMFLQSKPGSSGMSIKPDYFLFYGTNAQGKAVVEKLIP